MCYNATIGKYLKPNHSGGWAFFIGGVGMSDLELCMKWAANCKRCPRNRRCEEEYRKEMEQKSGGVSAKERDNRRKVWKMDGHRKGREQKKNGCVEMPL